VELRLFIKPEAFLKHAMRNRGSFLRFLQEIFREVEAFNYECEAFIKTTMLFEDIFREMEALIRNLRLFQRF
jgi:hypothetical protein